MKKKPDDQYIDDDINKDDIMHPSSDIAGTTTGTPTPLFNHGGGRQKSPPSSKNIKNGETFGRGRPSQY